MNVDLVPCVGATIATTVTTTGLAFTPAMPPTLQVGQVLKFTPTGFHDMTSDTGDFATPTGQEACLKFNVAGSYPFHCSQHPIQMTGTVVVQ